ncbi:DUF2142 domain-containing protein [Actinomyces urogenitalis]|nr:DUF2142 domain-containing protein [Actinomyces urogenitalis]MDK8834352.1 DUF2142 domain-containing protein [Actinomyces urogenitalis]
MVKSTVELCEEVSARPVVARRAQGEKSGRRSYFLYFAALLAMLLTGLGWAVASPVASSPDDDYHLGSIWCPRPVAEHCQTTEGQDGTWISVPEGVSPRAMTCYSFETAKSAACASGMKDDRYTYSFRYDDGGYPVGYYQFHHLLIGKDIESSVVRMRAVNVLISVILIGAISAMSRPSVRRAIGLAVAACWFPMGVYFIASNNPTSWAIAGLFSFTTAAFSAAQSHGWRRWALISAAAIGAILCLSSRFDVSFYMLVVALALTFAIRWNFRSRWPEFAFMWMAGLWGVYSMLGTTNQTALPTNGGGSGGGAGFSLPNFLWALASAPRYLAGFYGSSWSPGWVDVPTGEHAPYALSLIAAGAVLMVALRRGSLRKWFAALVIFGALVCLPAVFHGAGVFPVLFGYQARYILPLFGVLFFLLLALDLDDTALLSRPQHVAIVLLIGVAHSLTLYITILRFTRGVLGGQPRTLLNGIEWWWDMPVSPFAVWVGTSLTAFVFLAIALSVARQNLSFNTNSGTRV